MDTSGPVAKEEAKPTFRLIMSVAIFMGKMEMEMEMKELS